MKNIKHTLILSSIILLFGCTNNTSEIYFENLISNRKVNLSRKIGDSFSIIRSNDTITYSILYDKSNKFNYVINNINEDTIFSGLVIKKSNLFFLHEEANNGMYKVNVVSFKDSTVTGLEMERKQSKLLLEKIQDLKINYRYDSQNNLIVDPTKKEVKQLFKSVLDSLNSEKLIVDDLFDKTELEENSDNLPSPDSTSQAAEFIDRVFPNPFTNHLSIDFLFENHYLISIYSIDGTNVRTFKTRNEKSTSFDLPPNLRAGNYILKVKVLDDNWRTNPTESRVIVKGQ